VKINNKIKISLLLIIIIIISFFSINSFIEGNKFKNLKSLLSNQQKEFIKKYFFPHKHWSYQFKKELKFKKSEKDIEITKSSIELSNNKNLKKYKLNSGFHAGIHNFLPGSGYIDFYNNDIFVLSARGILVYNKNLEGNNENFKQIKNNINNFIGIEQFKKHRWFSLKDLLIFKNKAYVSYTEEIEKNCWNTSVIYGDISYDEINFKRLFTNKKCVHSIDNVDKDFNGSQSGGKIVGFDENNILLSVGDYRSRHLAQNPKSINGKIIKININNGKHKIISMGHRNPQGLYYDEENNFILETEHGPAGGDEINLIDVNKISDDKIQNYGWAIVSAGEHYGGKVEKNIYKYEKYPLYKSHSKYGFIEPLKSFVPSIAISDIVKVGKNSYVTSSMKKDNSLYFFKLDKEKKINNFDRVEVFERIRDLSYNDNKLYLFMEDTASIGLINLD